VGHSLKFGTSLATACTISSASGSLLTVVANTALLKNNEGASICESTGSDKSTVFFGGVSAPVLQAGIIMNDTIYGKTTDTITVANNLQVDNNLTVTDDFYAGKVVAPLVQAFAFESDTLRPNVNPGVTVEGDLHCTGNISYGALSSPFWVAGKVSGSSLEILSTKGRKTFSVERESGFPTGVFKISFDAHPDGADYIILITSLFTINYLTPAPWADNGSSNFTLTMKDSNNNNLTNGDFHFAVLR
jgi:hypothetical protein